MNYFQNPKIGEVALLRELDDNAGNGSSGKQRQDTRRPFPKPDPPLLRLRQLRGDLDYLGAYAALDYGRVVHRDDDGYGYLLGLIVQCMLEDAVAITGVAFGVARLKVGGGVPGLPLRVLGRNLEKHRITDKALPVLDAHAVALLHLRDARSRACRNK